MVATVENRLNTLITLDAREIKVIFNTRHGWDSDSILPAYKKHIKEIRESIESEGFKVSEPIEVYQDGEDNFVKEGHNRLEAALDILEDDENHVFVPGLEPGHIYCVLVAKPENKLDLLTSQINSNKSAGNTPLDLAKAFSVAMEQEILGEDGKPLKASPKQTEIGKRFGFTRQSVLTYLSVYKLPDEVKDWIQQGFLADKGDDDNGKVINLSWTNAVTLINEYDKKIEKVGKILLEAKKIVDKAPEKVAVFGSSVKIDWLRELGQKMYPENKPKASNNTKKTDASSQDDAEETNQNGNGTASTATTSTASTNGNSKTSGENNNEFKLMASLVKILKTNSEYIFEGKEVENSAFHPSGEYTITVPLEVGLQLRELLAALTGSKTLDAVEAVEETEEGIGDVSDDDDTEQGIEVSEINF